LEKWADKLLGEQDAKISKPRRSNKTQKPSTVAPVPVAATPQTGDNQPNFVTIYENGVPVTIGRYWADQAKR
jgi:hypothetical protein